MKEENLRYNPESSTLLYRVFAQIVISENGSYASEIANALDIGQSSASNAIYDLEELNIVKKGKRTQAQYYEPDFEQITKVIKDELDLNVLIKQELLKNYCRKYVRYKARSNLQNMFREDFAAAVKSYYREGHDDVPEWFEELAGTLEDEAPQFRAPAEFIEGALN